MDFQVVGLLLAEQLFLAAFLLADAGILADGGVLAGVGVVADNNPLMAETKKRLRNILDIYIGL
jgi:hypothetical protein